MTASVGIRIYEAVVRRKRDRTVYTLNAQELKVPTTDFLTQFVKDHEGDTIQSTELERSWYLEPRENDGVGNSRGYVHYGTFGFESNLVDTKTRKKNYTRQTTDVEEIPLFYEFWCPDEERAMIALQSFQGRSCIHLVMGRMQDHFEAVNPGFRLRVRKLMPNDVKGSLFGSAPVKRLTLIKRNASTDLADRYLDGAEPGTVDFEVSLSARRRRTLGDLASIFDRVKANEDGVVVHEGVAFSEAVAQIRIGGQLRRVGVFGGNSEAGVIDLTDMVEKGPSGHPTYESMVSQSNALLADFYSVISKS